MAARSPPRDRRWRVGPAAGGGDGGDAAQGREGRLGSKPVGVTARGDQQLGGGVEADAVGGAQAGVELCDQGVKGGGAAVRAWTRLARVLSAVSTAMRTPLRAGPRRARASVRLSPRRVLCFARMSSGAPRARMPVIVSSLGAGGPAGKGGPGGGVGVDGVGLAAPTAFGPVRSVYLDHRQSGLAGGAGEARAVGGGAFHPDRGHGAVGGDEGDRRCEVMLHPARAVEKRGPAAGQNNRRTAQQGISQWQSHNHRRPGYDYHCRWTVLRSVT
ncbi:hypothetical protein CFP65_0842 [Kitasatospora sp. MMS16-BH015]|nr:hypothetical protein CFP65_0842 [Kitasatospora sp. MMS16-BH015]